VHELGGDRDLFVQLRPDAGGYFWGSFTDRLA